MNIQDTIVFVNQVKGKAIVTEIYWHNEYFIPNGKISIDFNSMEGDFCIVQNGTITVTKHYMVCIGSGFEKGSYLTWKFKEGNV
jgi:hypothetical protein